MIDYLLNLSEIEIFFLIVGFVGQGLFASRFIVQWIFSEKKGESYIPVIFWYLSIFGGLGLLTYVKFKDTDYTQKAIRILHSPIITLTKDNDYNDIRFSMAAMGAVDIEPKKMKKFYDSYQYFASLLQNNKFKIDFRLEAGDIFCFNNRRVLHGRTEFEPNSGNRHLQGYYIERDEIIGRLNFFNNIKV